MGHIEFFLFRCFKFPQQVKVFEKTILPYCIRSPPLNKLEFGNHEICLQIKAPTSVARAYRQ